MTGGPSEEQKKGRSKKGGRKREREIEGRENINIGHQVRGGRSCRGVGQQPLPAPPSQIDGSGSRADGV